MKGFLRKPGILSLLFRGMRMEEQRKEAGRSVIRTLESEGYAAYFVGGYVRDLLLNRPLNDVDVATSALPEQVMEIFDHGIPTGIAHGTVTVLLDSIPIEVTTFRQETGYKDHRHPDAVFFVDKIEEDLSRRDFTINAMAMDLQGKLIDPYGGYTDLQNRIIRGVGNPETRFLEDPLRMLRGIRFASQLNFSIEEGTFSSIKKCASSIDYIAMERIQSEWNKAIQSTGAETALQMLVATGLYQYIAGMQIGVEGWREAGKLPFPLHRLPSLSLRLAFLFLQGKREGKALSILKSMKYDRKTMDHVIELIKMVEIFRLKKDRKSILEALLLHGGERAIESATLFDTLEQTSLTSQVQGIYNGMVVKSLQELAIKGDELQQNIKRKPGPWIGKVLHNLSMEVNLGLIPNEKNSLMEKARMVANEIT